jgi:hypothetical protein
MKQYNKNWITWFNKNKTKKLYNDVLIDIFPQHKRCRICDGPIYFYDSTFSINRNNDIFPLKKSYLSIKKLYNNNYHLSVCEDCLTEKFSEYKNMNKSRVFNKLNDITEFAFNIPKDIAEKFKNENYKVTKDNLIKKYGELIGNERWNSYKNKQAYTNTFDYKNKKYNWTLDKFKDYNKSRSITLSNLIDKHGEENGIKIWDEYIIKQKETKSKKYVINKYGLEYWIALCKSKKVTINHFIEKFGKEKGEELYINKIHNNIYLPSKISGEVFDRIDMILGKKYKTYYYKKDGFEFGKLLSNGRYVFLDYYILDLNICIEYYGNVWHANPNFYKYNDIPFSFKGNKKIAQEIWYDDKERISLLKKDFNIDTIVIWETDDISIKNILTKIKKLKNDKQN